MRARHRVLILGTGPESHRAQTQRTGELASSLGPAESSQTLLGLRPCRTLWLASSPLWLTSSLPMGSSQALLPDPNAVRPMASSQPCLTRTYDELASSLGHAGPEPYGELASSLGPAPNPNPMSRYICHGETLRDAKAHPSQLARELGPGAATLELASFSLGALWDTGETQWIHKSQYWIDQNHPIINPISIHPILDCRLL